MNRAFDDAQVAGFEGMAWEIRQQLLNGRFNTDECCRTINELSRDNGSAPRYMRAVVDFGIRIGILVAVTQGRGRATRYRACMPGFTD